MTALPNIPRRNPDLDFIIKSEHNSKVYFDHNPKEDTRIRVQADRDAYWLWCCENLVSGQWQSLIPSMGNNATYIFKNELDAVAFKLRFNINE
jgi:hypothetical protein